MKNLIKQVYDQNPHDRTYRHYITADQSEQNIRQLHNYHVVNGTLTEKQAYLYERWLTDFTSKLLTDDSK